MFQLRSRFLSGPAPAVVAAAGIALLAASGARAIPALVAGSMQRDLGWSGTDMFLPISLGMALSAIGSVFVASLFDRVGPRPVLLGGLLVLAGALAGSIVVSAPWQLLILWGLGLGLAGSLSAPVLGALIASRDIPSHCGAGSSLFASTILLGPALTLPLAATAADVYGWRGALSVGVLVLLIAAAMVDRGLRWSSWPRAPETSLDPFTVWRRASGAQRRTLAMLSGVFMICGASTSGLVDTHIGGLCSSRGLTVSAGAGVLAVTALSGLLSGFVIGWLTDRIASVTRLLVFYYVMRGLALLWLPHSTFGIAELYSFGAFYGLDWAATYPALTILVGRHFGRSRIGPPMGWMMIAHQGGAAMAATWIGMSGPMNYALAFSAVGFACLIAAVLVLLIDDYGKAECAAVVMRRFSLTRRATSRNREDRHVFRVSAQPDGAMRERSDPPTRQQHDNDHHY